MIPLLYKADESQFVTQGFGGLQEGRSIRVKRQVNGAYELEMQYPVSGRRFAELLPRRIIRATAGPDEGAQSFRIYRISKPLEGFCTVYARHLAYDLMGYTLRPFTANSLAEKKFEIAVQPEKEMVMILVPAEIKDDVLHGLYRAVGLKTPGQGIAFSLPVDATVGLMSTENTTQTK